MIFLFLSVAFFFVLFYVLGIIFLSVSKWYPGENPIYPFYFGFIVAGIYFLTINLFLPLNLLTLSGLLLITIVSIFFKQIRINLLEQLKKINTKYLIVCGFFSIIILLLFSIPQTVEAYDTNLYHASAVTWMNTFPSVKGLANLHGRLGMNSVYLSTAAGINVWIFNKTAVTVLPVLFSIATVLFFIFSLLNDAKKQFRIFSFFMLIWIFLYNIWTPNLYYDIASMVFSVILFFQLMEFFITPSDTKRNSNTLLYSSLLFASFSFAIKQMGAINVLFVLALSLSHVRKTEKKLSFIFQLLHLPLFLAIVYVARNLILTGYPLFPLPLLKFDFLWTTAESIIIGTYEDIKYWAKMPGELYMTVKNNDFLYWFIPWLKRFRNSNDFIFFCYAMFGFFFWITVFWKKKSQEKKAALFTLSLIIVNILFWFFTAPDFRFGSVLYFLFFACAIVFSVLHNKLYQLFFFAIFVTFFAGYWGNGIDMGFHISIVLFSIFIIFLEEKKIFSTSLVHKLEIFLLLCVLCIPNLRVLTKVHNVNLFSVAKTQSLAVKKVLVENKQNPPLFVWIPENANSDCTGDAPLPTAPSVNHALKLIEPANLQSGFYIKPTTGN